MDFLIRATIIGIVIIGTLSPLLTFAKLFQLKEWRWDRLLEHLRREGWITSLIGRTRLWMVLLYAFAMLSAPLWLSVLEIGGPAVIVVISLLILCTIIAFALISIAQILTKKQQLPVWTTKARLIVLTALLLTTVMSTSLHLAEPSFSIFFPGIIVLQPLFIALAWLIWKPMDLILKHRIMTRAMQLRSSWNDATVIGIAGSVGKTTTKELIAHLLQDLKPATTPAHVNTEMGVAQWLLNNYKLQTAPLRQRATAGQANYKLFIVEMGAYRKGEIALLCNIAQPTIGVMTALGSDHLALFGSEEAIIEANGELIEALPKDGHAFLYGDNEGCRSLAKKSPCPATIVGTTPDATIGAEDIKETPDGLQFYILHSTFYIPLHGHHNVVNTLLAIAIARHLGIADNRIKELLKTFHPTPHTFNVRTEQGVLLLDDTYNISPLSFHAALDWALQQKVRPHVLLTSSLQEIGAEEERFLKELGEKANTCIDRVIFTTKAGADFFAAGYGKPVEILNARTERVQSGSVLLCVGRMPLSIIQRLLPEK